MSLMINIFFMLVLTSLTGTFLHIIWLAGAKLAGHYSPAITYFSLKIVCLSYVLPVIYFFAWRNFDSSVYEIIDGKEENFRKTLLVAPLVGKIVFVLMILWLLAFMGMFIHRTIKYISWRLFISAKRKEKDVELWKKMEEHKKRISIRNNINLYRHGDLSTPLCTGTFIKKIILPEQNYSSKELDVIFLHELNHAKTHDLKMKWLAIWVNLIHWFNPIVYLLAHDVEIWSEAYCDIRSCKAGKGLFTAKEYYDTILKVANKNGNSGKCTITALSKEELDIKRRIWYMKMYQRSKKWVRAAMLVGVVSALAVGSTGAYAASSAVLTGYDNYMRENPPFEYETNEGKELEEIIIPNIEEQYTITDMTEETNSMARTQGTPYIWTLAPGEVKQISNISCKKDDTITVTCSLSGSSGYYVTAGIINPDGTGRFTKAKNVATYDFGIDSAGKYSVAAVNNNSVTITVSLTYFIS